MISAKHVIRLSGPRHWCGVVLVAFCCLLHAVRTAESAEEASVKGANRTARPNIVLIMADDLGFADLGCFGSEIETPQLDALAASGVQMTQFYNTAKCHSSRVSLLTGLYCDQAGSTSLSRSVTIAQLLQQAGYFTAMTGKWHLKGQPTDVGFQRYFGHLSGATNFFVGDNTFRLNGKPWNEFDKEFYTTVRNTDYAIEFVDEALESERPFFLYVAHNAPHYPLQALREDYEKYLGKYDVGWDAIRSQRQRRQRQLKLFQTPVTDLPRPGYIPAWEDLTAEQRQWESQRMAAYAGMVDRMDQEIGRLVRHLQQRQVWENTLFIFVSDNGACPFERTKGRKFPPYDSRSYWTYDTGWAHVGNVPFRYYKQNSHEGGIASPTILHWPAGIPKSAQRISDSPAHLIDLMATCVDVGQAEYPQDWQGRSIEPLQGKSLLPVMQGDETPRHEELYFYFGPNRGLRSGDWKAVSLRRGRWELYNLATDRNETRDLAAQFPDRVAAMSQRWHQLARDVDRLPKKRRLPVKDEDMKPTFRKNGR